MKKRTTRTIEISIKTDEHLIIKQRRNAKRLWCAKCRDKVEIISIADQGEARNSLQQRGLRTQAHIVETPEGLFACLDSLS